MPDAVAMNTVARGVSRANDPAQAVREVGDQIRQPGMSLVIFFCAPEYDRDALAAEFAGAFDGVDVIGCTSAGEITPSGYHDGSLTAVSLAAEAFTCVTRHIDDLAAFEMSAGEAVAEAALHELKQQHDGVTPENTFAFVMIDGLSLREEAVACALHNSLQGIPLCGGSAGDGTAFGRTGIYHDGTFRSDRAAFVLVHTQQPLSVFKTQHYLGSDTKMVVTEANPHRRIVHEIDGEPAARAYARLIGYPVDDLAPAVFAEHPIVVRIGGDDFVRSIQQIGEDLSLTFYCAIDEGLVLSLSRSVDMVDNLRDQFAAVVRTIGEPQLVLGCDCILRKLEAERRGIKDAVADILLAHNTVGFSTYGEQLNSMHINQTFTGVAIGGAASAS